MTSNVPVLETERLLLRGHRLDDFSACAAMWADPVTVRYISGKPSTEQQSWMRLIGYAGLWAALGFGYWAVEEKATGRYAGELGFADFRRDIEPSIAGVPELGWVLAPAFHGKGYATEGVRAATAWGDVRFASARTVCIVDPENLASIRVAEKCGYREYARTTLSAGPAILFERLAPPAPPK